MVIGGKPIARVLPLAECIVPEGTTGPVFLYVRLPRDPRKPKPSLQMPWCPFLMRNAPSLCLSLSLCLFAGDVRL